MKREKTVAKHRAFTLIELLIVVAIIAILAAIAVPNFLEAQTRTKITSVMSDMNTVAKAMEMYHIDNGRYINWAYPNPDPGGRHGCFLFMEGRDGLVSAAGSCGLQLTTPITYLSSLPWDPFWTLTLAQIWPTVNQSSFHMSMQTGEFYQVYGNQRNDPWVFGYTRPPILRENYAGWWFMSVGPNMKMYADDPSTLYDPTNGTISNGDIYWCGGIGLVGGLNNTYAGYDSY